MRHRKASVGIIGGAMAGLAAAHYLSTVDKVGHICVFERQSYEEKRVNCGEAINDASLIPLDKVPSNGFLNDIEGFELRVHTDTDRSLDESPLSQPLLSCDNGYICNRATVEQRWAQELVDSGVSFETNYTVDKAEYWDIVNNYDYVIDATGNPSLSHRARGSVEAYTGDMVALNASVEGDFADYVDWPRIFFEGYVGYAWAFPKSSTLANVGIGWAGDQRPGNYYDALVSAAERNDFPIPSRDAVNIYTIPRGPSLAPSDIAFDNNVFLVGDAAGIANRYQGEGICQGIRSAYILGSMIEEGNSRKYPQRLYSHMRSEYRLAHLMRGAWIEHKDPQLLADIARALDGLSIDAITRQPRQVLSQVLQQPRTAIRLFANSGMLSRVAEAYTDTWEYNS